MFLEHLKYNTTRIKFIKTISLNNKKTQYFGNLNLNINSNNLLPTFKFVEICVWFFIILITAGIILVYGII